MCHTTWIHKRTGERFRWLCRSWKLPDIERFTAGRDSSCRRSLHFLTGGILLLQKHRKRRKTLQIGHVVIEYWQMVATALAVYDFAAVCIAYFLALFLRFDGSYTSITPVFRNSYGQFILP